MKNDTERIRKFFHAADNAGAAYWNYRQKRGWNVIEHTTDTSRFQIRKGKMYFDGEELIFARCGVGEDWEKKDARGWNIYTKYGALTVTFYSKKTNREFDFFVNWHLAFTRQSIKNFYACFEMCRIANLAIEK